jgi:hypothetical protein
MTNATPTQIIHGYRSARLTANERSEQLIRRPWTRRERTVVLHGFFGRLCIAVEPILCCVMFLALTIGTLIVRTDPQHPDDHNLVILSPIFGLGVVACVFYAVCVMLAPTRALLQTLRPIFIVDGYVKYRGPDNDSPVNSNGYVAVLTHDGNIACEWATLGEVPLSAYTAPALCEFSEYGGVHRVDGRPTGVLPDTIPRLGIGLVKRRDIIP